MRVLLVGGGGRACVLARNLARSLRLDRLVAERGNPGIGGHATCVPVADDTIGDLAVLSKDIGEKASGRR